jgi:hypothetical protein
MVHMKAIFLRVLEETEDKNRALRQAIESRQGQTKKCRFDVNPKTFGQIPRSPFAYWVSDRVRSVFASLPVFESDERTTKVGLATANDFRFVRIWTEVTASHLGSHWFPFAKGGKYSPYYSDLSVVVNWCCSGNEMKAFTVTTPGTTHWSRNIRSPDHYFRPGLTWPLRAHRFSPQLLPKGCIFSVRGYAAFAPADSLLSILGVFSSSVFDYLFKVSLGRDGHPEFVVGVLSSLPWPKVRGTCAKQLSASAVRAWSIKRAVDTGTETSHAFYLPTVLQMKGKSLADRAASWAKFVAESESEITHLQSEIDDRCFELYGLGGTERDIIEMGSRGVSNKNEEHKDKENVGDQTGQTEELDTVPAVVSLLSWSVGVAFGRFDIRLANGEYPAPAAAEPFDPLPVCSPGMLMGEDGLLLDSRPAGYAVEFPPDGILVDDAGAPGDLVHEISTVFEDIFDYPTARLSEAAEILGYRDRGLRGWLASEFFELHVKRYSTSSRKAPIYWQLATPSGAYSAWLYCHRFTPDTLFRLLNDRVAPKLQHEERKLTNLTQDAGASPAASQRKEIHAQETFVGELRAFRDDVARVAPLWKPDLNDGVILNFAPLWRLVPHHKAWQKECKSAWDKLCKGDFDWAHLAMHLWPERVVPKCAKDRSLAIAHGVEQVFWFEDEDGKWLPKAVTEEEVTNLVAERTSLAAKEALRSLLEAPAPTSGANRASRRRKRVTRPKAPTGSAITSTASEKSRAAGELDSDVLGVIRSAIESLGGGASKADILEETGLPAAKWGPAITALLAEGSVTRTGEKRGSRYHIA